MGILGSTLCLLHCAATPLLIGGLSAVGLGFLGDEMVHKVLAVVLVGVAVLAFGPGFKSHRNAAVLGLGGAGIALLLATGFFLEPLLTEFWEVGLTVVGSVLLVGAHVVNWRLTVATPECCPTH